MQERFPLRISGILKLGLCSCVPQHRIPENCPSPKHLRKFLPAHGH